MTNTPHDLRDYVLDELTPQQRAEVERYLATSVEAREEVERLRLTQQSLLSLPEEEPPRRIAFVSDKVFEPSLARRLWQSFLQGAPRLAFGMAAVLVVLFAGAWATQPTLTSDSSGWRLAFGAAAVAEQPVALQASGAQVSGAQVSQGLTAEQIRQVTEILQEREARTQEALAELVRSEGVRSHAEIRTEIEQMRQASELAFQLQKARLDQLQLNFAENSALASFEGNTATSFGR
jgi:anti-sigma factor RsiW